MTAPHSLDFMFSQIFGTTPQIERSVQNQYRLCYAKIMVDRNSISLLKESSCPLTKTQESRGTTPKAKSS